MLHNFALPPIWFWPILNLAGWRRLVGRSKPSASRRDVEKRLADEGWRIVRKGSGDHVPYKNPAKSGRVTIDTSTRDIPPGTLRSIFEQAGWVW